MTNYTSSLRLVTSLSALSLCCACGESPTETWGESELYASSAPTGTLVAAANAQPISGFDPIAEGATITLSALSTSQLSIRGNATTSVGSLKLVLDGGTITRIESTAPYALCGDSTTSFTPCPELNVAGNHTLTLTEYSGPSGSGTPGATSTLHFTVKTSGTAEPPPTEPPPTEPPPTEPPPTAPQGGSVAFPLKVSGNQRYLVDQNNVPFPILGDSGWEVAHNLVRADQDTYLADRAARGFNALIVEAIEHKFTTKKPPMDFASNLPFTRRLDAATYTGSPNGTDSTSGSGTIVAGPTFGADPYSNINAQAPDFTYPGSAYWAEMDSYIGRAAGRGMVVFLFPAYVGWGGGDEGWMRELVANNAVIGAGGVAGQSYGNASKSRAWNYGAWLANHYSNYANIVWVAGGDYGGYDSAESSAVSQLIAGMKSVPNQKSTLWTSHWARPSFGSDLSQFSGQFGLESIYTNVDAALQARTGYTRAGARPAIVIEGLYEDNPNAGGPVRKLQWASLFGAPAGQFFGATAMWAVGSQWRSAMDTPGTREQALLNGFVRSIPWQGLVPSGLNGQKTIVVSNNGTGSGDYVACAASAVLAGCYVPPGWARGNFGVDATVLSAPFRARWLNPTTGAYTLVSNNVTNSGVVTFTPPGNNGSGATDWVLVLDTAGFVPPTEAPNAPPSFTSAAAPSQSPVTGSSVALAALAGDDGGEAALTYTWSTTGTPPAAVAFNANGSNTAKNTVATFSKAGSYAFRVVATDAQGLTAASSVTVSVSQKLSSITVSPGSANVAPGATQAFTAAAKDQFGAALSSPAYTWSVSGGGSIGSSGTFTAGSTAGGPFTVAAASAGVRGTASVTVTSAPPPQPQSFSVGQTSVLGTSDSGNGGWLIAQPITLGQAAAIQSLSFYVAGASGSLRLGLYDASGAATMPGRKLAETAELTPTQAGWATAPVVQSVTLQPGKYWLVYFSSSNGLQTRRTGHGAGETYYYQSTYGALPGTFSPSATHDNVWWSFFATFLG